PSRYCFAVRLNHHVVKQLKRTRHPCCDLPARAETRIPRTAGIELHKRKVASRHRRRCQAADDDLSVTFQSAGVAVVTAAKEIDGYGAPRAKSRIGLSAGQVSERN